MNKQTTITKNGIGYSIVTINKVKKFLANINFCTSNQSIHFNLNNSMFYLRITKLKSKSKIDELKRYILKYARDVFPSNATFNIYQSDEDDECKVICEYKL